MYPIQHEGKTYAPKLTEPPPGDHCADCGELLAPPAPGSITTGYAILTDDDGKPLAKVCYHCAHVREYDYAKKTGELFAYLDKKPDPNYHGVGMMFGPFIWSLQSWSGETFATVRMGTPYRSNFGDKRYPFTFKLAGQWWYGTGYGGEGMYARCHRSRAKKGN